MRCTVLPPFLFPSFLLLISLGGGCLLLSSSVRFDPLLAAVSLSLSRRFYDCSFLLAQRCPPRRASQRCPPEPHLLPLCASFSLSSRSFKFGGAQGGWNFNRWSGTVTFGAPLSPLNGSVSLSRRHTSCFLEIRVPLPYFVALLMLFGAPLPRLPILVADRPSD